MIMWRSTEHGYIIHRISKPELQEGLDQGWRTFLRPCAQTVYKFREKKKSFACLWELLREKYGRFRLPISRIRPVTTTPAPT